MKYVIDSCVLFDLVHGGIWEDFVDLEVELYIPDVLKHELITPPWEFFSTAGIIVESFSPKEVQEIQSLRNLCLGPKVTDLFAFVLANKKNIGLLTADKDLRDLGEEHNVIVHGSLWVLDLLVKNGKINRQKAIDALQKMIDKGSRFPTKAVDSRFKRWGDSK